MEEGNSMSELFKVGIQNMASELPPKALTSCGHSGKATNLLKGYKLLDEGTHRMHHFYTHFFPFWKDSLRNAVASLIGILLAYTELNINSTTSVIAEDGSCFLTIIYKRTWPGENEEGVIQVKTLTIF
jgi:hypothetical protein